MSGFSIFYPDGTYTNFPGSTREQSDTITSWFSSSNEDAILTVNLPEKNTRVHIARRYITRIEVYG